jgi:hypothetical protein
MLKFMCLYANPAYEHEVRMSNDVKVFDLLIGTTIIVIVKQGTFADANHYKVAL